MNATNAQLAIKSLCIAIPSEGPESSHALDPRFGRCRWILLYTPEDNRWQALERDPDQIESGAGRAAANLLAVNKVNVLLAGKIGPKAATALADAGIQTYEDCQGICSEVVSAWLSKRVDG